MTGIARFLLPLLALGLATAAPADSGDKPAPAIAGHYYLSGMMEFGSELLLDEDGSFRWFISYGSVDREAEGAWSLEGGTLTLTPQISDKPVSFYPAETRPWNDETDTMLEMLMKERAREAFRHRCPIAALQEYNSHAISDAPFMGPPTEEELLRSKEFADVARDHAQSVLDQLTGQPGWQQDPEMVAEVDAALAIHAQAEMRRVYESDRARVSGMATPESPAPLQLPAECEPDEPEEAQAERGVLVVMFDPRLHAPADGFEVEASYDRGRARRATIGTEGAAFIPLAEGRRITALAVAAPEGVATTGESRFPMSIAEPKIAVIHADLPPVAPFERLHLTVEDDGSLVPVDLLRGRYVRSSQ